jgi:hypothetical protein
VAGQRPGWGALALCQPDRKALADEYARHATALADLRRVNYEQPKGEAVTNHRYIVITPQIVGTAADHSTAYTSDMIPHDDREVAIGHGLETLGHDDFCIGTVDAGRLVAYGWGMDDFAEDDCDDLDVIAGQLGLPATRAVTP